MKKEMLFIVKMIVWKHRDLVKCTQILNQRNFGKSATVLEKERKSNTPQKI